MRLAFIFLFLFFILIELHQLNDRLEQGCASPQGSPTEGRGSP